MNQDAETHSPCRADALRPLATSTLLTFMSLLPSLSLIHLGSQPPPAPTGHRYWTTKRDGEVRLRQDDSFPYETPLTVHDMVMGTATKYANYIALGSKHRHGWHLLTYIELYEECRRAAKAFLQVPARLRAAPPPPRAPLRPQTSREAPWAPACESQPLPHGACSFKSLSRTHQNTHVKRVQLFAGK